MGLTLDDLHRLGHVAEAVGGCLEWNAARTRQGYGWLPMAVARELGERRAHRAALVLATGQPVPAGLNVLHSCDNPPCIAIDHLRAGTQRENIREAADRGRLNGAWQWSAEQRRVAGLDGSAAGDGHPRLRDLRDTVHAAGAPEPDGADLFSAVPRAAG